MRLTITLLCLTLGLAACSFSSSDPPPPRNTTIVVPAQPGTYSAPAR